jgi:hypothetical protein
LLRPVGAHSQRTRRSDGANHTRAEREGQAQGHAAQGPESVQRSRHALSLFVRLSAVTLRDVRAPRGLRSGAGSAEMALALLQCNLLHCAATPHPQKFCVAFSTLYFIRHNVIRFVAQSRFLDFRPTFCSPASDLWRVRELDCAREARLSHNRSSGGPFSGAQLACGVTVPFGAPAILSSTPKLPHTECPHASLP